MRKINIKYGPISVAPEDLFIRSTANLYKRTGSYSGDLILWPITIIHLGDEKNIKPIYYGGTILIRPWTMMGFPSMRVVRYPCSPVSTIKRTALGRGREHH